MKHLKPAERLLNDIYNDDDIYRTIAMPSHELVSHSAVYRPVREKANYRVQDSEADYSQKLNLHRTQANEQIAGQTRLWQGSCR
ncbi:hypothetical protein Pla144_02790 [Bythopirellula polymerisocia]|uniref:Uncharacterized protein n=1 Tax=Bythopirellula polymerisocia TaxID=2528003 RepID=A0A5C6D177_9BACT|nr:hypothetical protein Pla144_02790 [Bythopirellula polymerisocia]